MSAAARAVARKDRATTRRLMDEAPFISRFLRWEDGQPAFKDPVDFESAFARVQAGALEQQETSQAAGKKGSVQKGRLQRIMAIWNSAQPRAKLLGLVLPSGEVAYEPDRVRKGLADHWSGAFRWRASDSVESDWFGRFAEPLGEMRPPSRRQAATVISKAVDRAPGWDGLPSSCWKALGAVASHMC